MVHLSHLRVSLFQHAQSCTHITYFWCSFSTRRCELRYYPHRRSIHNHLSADQNQKQYPEWTPNEQISCGREKGIYFISYMTHDQQQTPKPYIFKTHKKNTNTLFFTRMPKHTYTPTNIRTQTSLHKDGANLLLDTRPRSRLQRASREKHNQQPPPCICVYCCDTD